jgi:hypothetical protein
LFGLSFRKYGPPENTYSPYYSWDADMSLRMAVLRHGPGTIGVTSVFQTVGIAPFGSRVGVGGTGYLLGIHYSHTLSASLTVSTGISHLSSHLTRDLDERTARERERGATIPTVEEPDQYNVLFARGFWRFPEWPLTPELEAIIHPGNFRLGGGELGYVRPVHFGSRWLLWRGSRTSLAAETRHEFGRNPFNRFMILLDLNARNRDQGRFQLFVSLTPGSGFHVSPTLGALRDGVALGFRTRLQDD